MGRRREPQGTGPKAYYRPKASPGQSLSLTELGRCILDAAAERTGRSRSDVIERLLREHGATVEFPPEPPAAALAG